ncbi:hypothetical protein AHAS_Ahas04G0144200 [Arachis hypogaea]
MSNNLYCLSESGEKCALRVVVKLDLEDLVDVVRGATRMVVTLWFDLRVEKGKEKDGKEDCEGEEGEYEC